MTHNPVQTYKRALERHLTLLEVNVGRAIVADNPAQDQWEVDMWVTHARAIRYELTRVLYVECDAQESYVPPIYD